MKAKLQRLSSKVARDSRWLPIVFFWVGLMLVLFVVIRFFRH